MEWIMKRRLGRRVVFLCVALGALVAGLAVIWMTGSGGSDLKSAWEALDGYLRKNPRLIFWALVVLPGLPFPTSALLVIAGVVWKDQPLMACAICMSAIAINMTWTYWLAAGVGRGMVVRLLKLTKYSLPEFRRESDLRIVLILRLVPGFPLFLQNYLLGFLHVPFRLYLPVSLLCNGVMACGVVLSSSGIAGANFMPMISGIALIVLALVVIHSFRKRLGAGRKTGGERAGEG
jgi:uncharacterized membrane protein YdjX (TVP38/TMEM64 family)